VNSSCGMRVGQTRLGLFLVVVGGTKSTGRNRSRQHFRGSAAQSRQSVERIAAAMSPFDEVRNCLAVRAEG